MTKPSVYYVTIEPDFSGQRIDNFLLARLKGVPRTHIYRIVRKGEVRVNKKRVDASYKLQAGDYVRIPPVKLDTQQKTATPHANLTAFLKTRILYEDAALLIINKPAGMAVHGGSGVNLGVVEALRAIYPKLPHLELAHRLDLGTSGCLVLAKKRSALRELHELLREGRVSKKYLALTKGQWKKSECRVEVSLQKNHLSSGERIVRVDREGKPSLTEFHTIENFPYASLVEAVLFTGRTHQIRVHAQYRGHPLAGDEKYGDREFNKKMSQLGLKRMFLHAHSIEFTMESSQTRVSVKAPLEEELENFIQKLKTSA